MTGWLKWEKQEIKPGTAFPYFVFDRQLSNFKTFTDSAPQLD